MLPSNQYYFYINLQMTPPLINNPYQNYSQPLYYYNLSQNLNTNYTNNTQISQQFQQNFQPIPHNQQDLPLEQSEESNGDRKRKNRINSKKKRGKNLLKELQSAKKNSQSNIINQLFSFYSNKDNLYKLSYQILKKTGQTQTRIQKISSILLNIIRCKNNKRGKIYVSKKTLLQYCIPQLIVKEIPQLQYQNQLLKEQEIQIQKICKIFHKCCINYLKTQCLLSIVTSKRLTQQSKLQHLKRRRIILRFLEDNKSFINRQFQ